MFSRHPAAAAQVFSEIATPLPPTPSGFTFGRPNGTAMLSTNFPNAAPAFQLPFGATSFSADQDGPGTDDGGGYRLISPRFHQQHQHQPTALTSRFFGDQPTNHYAGQQPATPHVGQQGLAPHQIAMTPAHGGAANLAMPFDGPPPLGGPQVPGGPLNNDHLGDYLRHVAGIVHEGVVLGRHNIAAIRRLSSKIDALADTPLQSTAFPNAVAPFSAAVGAPSFPATQGGPDAGQRLAAPVGGTRPTAHFFHQQQPTGPTAPFYEQQPTTTLFFGQQPTGPTTPFYDQLPMTVGAPFLVQQPTGPTAPFYGHQLTTTPLDGQQPTGPTAPFYGYQPMTAYAGQQGLAAHQIPMTTAHGGAAYSGMSFDGPPPREGPTDDWCERLELLTGVVEKNTNPVGTHADQVFIIKNKQVVKDDTFIDIKKGFAHLAEAKTDKKERISNLEDDNVKAKEHFAKLDDDVAKYNEKVDYMAARLAKLEAANPAVKTVDTLETVPTTKKRAPKSYRKPKNQDNCGNCQRIKKNNPNEHCIDHPDPV